MSLRLNGTTVSGSTKTLTYSPALDTLSDEQIETLKRDVRDRQIMLANVNVWSENQKFYSWLLNVVESDLRRVGQ